MYWMQGEPPEHIQKIIDSWRALPNVDIRLFDDQSAQHFIQSHLGQRYVDAYLRCNIPAMRSDYFRWCLLVKRTGIYADTDLEIMDFEALYSHAKKDGLMILRKAKREHGWNVRNDLIIVHKRNTPIIKYALKTATENIEARRHEKVWLATGPAILTFYRFKDPTRFERWTLLPQHLGDKYVKVHNPPYKKTSIHWFGRTDLYR